MLLKKRKFERFDIYLVTEFRPLKRLADPFIGITRNFSCGGLSFESQTFGLQPGENVQFKLRHPKTNLSVSNVGEIVWKKKTDKFDCLTGIKFKETDEATKSRMLEIMSAAGNIPLDSFLYGDSDERAMRNKNEERAAAKPADVIKKLAPEPIKKINEVIDVPATPDKFKTEDTLDNKTSDTDIKVPGDKGSRKQIIRDIHNELLEMERARRKRIRVYIPVTVIAAFVLTLALYSLNKEPLTDFNKPVPDVPKSVSSQPIEKKPAENTGIVQANKILKETVPDIPKPAPPKAAKKRPPKKTVNAQISKSLKKPVPASLKPATRRAIGEKRLNNTRKTTTANIGYFIQVGAWKNVKYARSILIRLKKNYPEAYIAVENNYNKIRIPDIKSKKHGAVILRNIEKKFRLKPVLLHTKT